jgi:type IV secretory pathway VirB10-like protein
MSLINFFFKKNNGGKREATVLTFAVVCCVVLASYYLSKDKDAFSQDSKEQVLKEKDIAEASVNIDKQGKRFEIPVNMITRADENIKKAGNQHDGRPQQAISHPVFTYGDTKDRKSDDLVPLGSMVQCILVHNIVTNNFSSPVIVQVTKDFYFNRLLLPVGTRIYGTARPGIERDRVLAAFHTIIFQDGREIKIRAIGLSEDGSAGLTAVLVNRHNKKRILGGILNFLSGALLGFQETATNAITGIREIETTTRNAALEGGANSFEKEAARLEKEIDKAEGYGIVSVGSKVLIYFEKTIDVKPS